MGYQQLLNQFAYNAITKPCQIPDYHLMIGTAEDLSSQPIVHYVDFMPKSTYKLLPAENLTYEDVQEHLAAGTLTIDDFFTGVEPLGDAIYKI